MVSYKEKIDFLKNYISEAQLKTIITLSKNNRFYVNKINKIYHLIKKMPKTYETENIKTNDKVLQLHYFNSCMDYYIIENDTEIPPYQSFGVTKTSYGEFELGYINIVELINNGVELDLYFKPIRFGELKKD